MALAASEGDVVACHRLICQNYGIEPVQVPRIYLGGNLKDFIEIRFIHDEKIYYWDSRHGFSRFVFAAGAASPGMHYKVPASWKV